MELPVTREMYAIVSLFLVLLLLHYRIELSSRIVHKHLFNVGVQGNNKH